MTLTNNTTCCAAQGLKCENMRLLLDKSGAHQRMQEISLARDGLRTELAKLKKVGCLQWQESL